MRNATNLEVQDRGETLPFFARVRNSSNKESSLGGHFGNYSVRDELMHVTWSASHTYFGCTKAAILVISQGRKLTQRSGKKKEKKELGRNYVFAIPNPAITNPRAQVEKRGSCIPAIELYNLVIGYNAFCCH